MRYVLPEGYGILELSHVVIPLLGLFIAVRLLFRPFVRARPLVFKIGATSCLYIAGKRRAGVSISSIGTRRHTGPRKKQTFTTLMTFSKKTPRLILQVGILVGGLLVPIAAAFVPRLRANRMALFLPAVALLPTALGVMTFMLAGALHKGGVVGELIHRPSETVETYLYFFIFILAYLIVYARRIRELEGSSV